MISTSSSPSRRRLQLLSLFVLAPWFAPTASAQVPKPGGWYEDKTDLGFKVGVPDNWEVIPPTPDDGNLIIKFDPKSNKVVQMGTDQLEMSCWVVRFDKNHPKPSATNKKHYAKDLTAWIKSGFVDAKPDAATKKDLTIDKIAAVELEYSIKFTINEARVYTMTYKLTPETEVAVVYIGPGEKKWQRYQQVYEQMAKTFKTIATKDVAGATAASDSLRDTKRAKLTADMAKLGGDWKLYETPRYFIVSNNTDREFINELKERLEAIRDIYERDYPVAKVIEIKIAAATNKTADEKEPKDPKDVKDPKVDPETKVKQDMALAVERSHCSVVRVCANAEQYHSYGGPDGSAGFWDNHTEELVLYDDKAVGGRSGTWSVLNHEAFHQYIFYFYGSLSPHCWYNEGTGDFYSGFEYAKNKTFTLKKFKWRVSTIQEAIRTNKPDANPPKITYCPLAEFVKWTQPEYYGSNKYGLGGGENYAQGWSFIFFLRTAKQNHFSGWNTAWDSILDTYFRVLASSGKVEQADDEAFKGIDFDALEAAWKAYTK